jgi:penicillin V acylase-like amidase (Ntn superfamily)
MDVRWACFCLLAAMMVIVSGAETMTRTGITLLIADGAVVRGCTLNHGNALDSDVILIPRAAALAGATPDGEEAGLQWMAT